MLRFCKGADISCVLKAFIIAVTQILIRMLKNYTNAKVTCEVSHTNKLV